MDTISYKGYYYDEEYPIVKVYIVTNKKKLKKNLSFGNFRNSRPYVSFVTRNETFLRTPYVIPKSTYFYNFMNNRASIPFPLLSTIVNKGYLFSIYLKQRKTKNCILSKCKKVKFYLLNKKKKKFWRFFLRFC